MKYVKQQPDGNWKVVEVNNPNDPAIEGDGWYKLVDHEEPHESWDRTMWQAVELLEVQESLKIVHRHYRIAPIDAYEPEQPKLV